MHASWRTEFTNDFIPFFFVLVSWFLTLKSFFYSLFSFFLTFVSSLFKLCDLSSIVLTILKLLFQNCTFYFPQISQISAEIIRFILIFFCFFNLLSSAFFQSCFLVPKSILYSLFSFVLALSSWLLFLVSSLFVLQTSSFYLQTTFSNNFIYKSIPSSISFI